jgi:hypothetical protein
LASGRVVRSSPSSWPLRLPAVFLSMGILLIEIFVERGAFSLWLLKLWKADKSSTLDGVDATRDLKSGDGGISTKTWDLLLCNPRPGVDDADVLHAMCKDNNGQLWK